MDELQPPENNPLAPPPPTTTITATTPTTTSPSLLPPLSTDTEHNNNNLGPSLAPKRQRRPSVRLGEIGDPRRPNKTWKFHKDPSLVSKTSKTRPLTNLVNGVDNYHDTITATEDHHHHNITHHLEFTNRKPKSKKPTKRARSNWPTQSKFGDNGTEDTNHNTNNDDEEIREFEPEVSDSPVHSIDNVDLDYWDNRRPIRARVSDNDNGATTPELNFQKFTTTTSSDGVRDWLIGLGLGRYAPVFEIHEVDDEVLPMLTLEDLKDMGINAVGSRRKLYAAILKLRKGFS